MSLAGNQALPRRGLALETRPGRALDDSLLERDCRAIAARYAALGHLWAEVRAETSSTGQGVTVVFRIRENEPARLGVLRLVGNRMIAGPRLRPVLPFSQGRFRPGDPAGNARALVRFYADNGYPFCQVHVDSLAETRPEVSYALKIDEGPEVRLRDVRFSGRFETRAALLRRILGLSLDRPFSETETRKALQRLNQDPLVEVRDIGIRLQDRTYWLEVRGGERRSNRVNGLLAYGGADRELTGNLDLNLGNLFGTRREFSVNWRSSRARQDLSAGYREPWLLGTPVTLTAGVRNRYRDSSFSATELRLAARTGIAEHLALGLDGAYSFEASGIAALPPSRTTWVGTALEIDRRDQPANPGRGLAGGVFIDLGSRRVADTTSTVIARSRVEAGVHIPLLLRWSLTLGARGWGVFSPDTVYAYDLFELGGAGTLRGFREDEFRTDRCAWAFLEPRYRLGRTGRLYPFFDVAIIRDPEQNRFNWHSGYGAGLRIETTVGQFGLDYGIRTGASPLRGKVHFSVETVF